MLSQILRSKYVTNQRKNLGSAQNEVTFKTYKKVTNKMRYSPSYHALRIKKSTKRRLLHKAHSIQQLSIIKNNFLLPVIVTTRITHVGKTFYIHWVSRDIYQIKRSRFVKWEWARFMRSVTKHFSSKVTNSRREEYNRKGTLTKHTNIDKKDSGYKLWLDTFVSLMQTIIAP